MANGVVSSGITVKFGADLSGLSSGINQAKSLLGGLNDTTSGIGNSITSAFQNPIGSILNFGAKIGESIFWLKNLGSTAVSLAGGLLQPAESAEQMTTAFTTLLGSTQAASEELAKLDAFAAKTPFKTMDIDQAASQLIGFGIDAQSVIPDLTAMGDALSAVGKGSTANLMGVVNIFGKIQTSGTLTVGIMQQLSRYGINAWAILEKETGKTKDQLQEMISKGLIPAKDAMNMLTKGIESNPLYAGGMAKQSQTLVGLISTLKSNWDQLMAAFGTPIIKSLEGDLSKVGDLLASPLFKTFASDVGRGIANAFTWISNATGRAIDGTKEFIKHLEQGPPNAFSSSLLYMGEQFKYIFQVIGGMGIIIFTRLKEAFTGTGGVLSGVLASAMRLVGNLFHWLGEEAHRFANFLAAINLDSVIGGFSRAGEFVARFIRSIDPIPVKAFFSSLEYLGTVLGNLFAVIKGVGIFLFHELFAVFDDANPKTQKFYHQFTIINGVITETRGKIQNLISDAFLVLRNIIVHIIETLEKFSNYLRSIDWMPLILGARKLKEGLSDLKAPLSYLASLLTKDFTDALKFAGKEIGKFGEWFGKLLEPAFKKITPSFNQITNVINGFSNIINKINFHPLAESFQNIASLLGGQFKQILQFAGDEFKQIGGWVSGSLVPALRQVLPHFLELGSTVLNTVIPAMIQIKGIITQVAENGFKTLVNVVETLEPPFIKVAGIFAGDLSTGFKTIVPLVKNLAGLMGGEFSKEIKDLGEDAKQLGLWFTSSVVPAFQKALPGFMNLGSTILGTVIPAFIQIRGIVVDVIQHAFQVFAPIVEKIIPPLIIFAGVLANNIANGFKFIMPYVLDAAKAIGDFAKDIMDRVAPIITGVIDGITPLLQDLFTFWNAIWPGMSMVLQGVWNEIVGVIKIVWAIISGLFKIGLDLISGNWDMVWKDMKDMLGGIWDGIKTFVSGGIQAMLGTLMGIGGLIYTYLVKPFEGALGSIGGVFSAIGKLIADATAFNWGAIPGDLHTLHIPGFADGVENFKGGWALVGEKGPELLKLPKGSDVLNASSTANILKNFKYSSGAVGIAKSGDFQYPKYGGNSQPVVVHVQQPAIHVHPVVNAPDLYVDGKKMTDQMAIHLANSIRMKGGVRAH